MLNYFSKVITFLSITLLFPVLIVATDLAITAPGVYSLSANMVSTPVAGPAGSNNIIKITASNVTLDLKDFSISQGNSLANFNGIDIAPNLSNITIKNGNVKLLSGIGINVGAGCSQIVIDNVNLSLCVGQAIAFGSFYSTSAILDSKIINCTVSKCANSSTAPVWLGTCTRCIVSDCVVNNCGFALSGGSDNTYGSVYLTSCNSCVVERVKIQSNSQYGAVTLWASAGNTVSDCIYTGATGNLGTTGGFSMRGSSNGNLFKNCVAENNTAYTAHGYFAIENYCSLNTLDNCFATGNQVIGIAVNFFTVYASNQNLVSNCIASGNTSNGQIRGFWGFSTQRTSFVNCISANNISNSGFLNVKGMLLENTSYCEVTDSQFYNNSGSSDAQSWGLDVVNSNNNLYTHISAYANGPVNPIAAQQMSVGSTGAIVP